MRVLALIVALLISGLAHAAENGTFGVGILVRGSGFILNPTIREVVITELEKDMPAEKAGVTIGDSLLEVSGRTVQGAKASEIRPLLLRPVGESVMLKLRRATGEEYSVSLVAAAKRR
jgi:C-terminal processing protease CtpA/Prc